MSEMYESIMKSLSEEVNDIKVYGKSRGRKTVLEVTPVKKYSPEEVKTIRKQTGTSQAVFAKLFGVSKKTVEAWEEGVNIPSGPACRILELFGTGSTSADRYLVKK